MLSPYLTARIQRFGVYATEEVRDSSKSGLTVRD